MVELRYKVLIERKGFAFFLELEYENILDFCDKCKIIGRDKRYCKKFPENGDKAINQNRKIKTRNIFLPIKCQNNI